MEKDKELFEGPGLVCVHQVAPNDGRPMQAVKHGHWTPCPSSEELRTMKLPLLPIPNHEYRELFEKLIRLSVADGDASARTVSAYREGLAVFLEWCSSRGRQVGTAQWDGPLDPKTVTFDEVQEYRRWLAERYKPATSRLRLRAVRILFQALQRWGVRKDNPADGVRAARARTTPEDMVLQKALTPAEAMTLWKSAWPAAAVHRVQEAAILSLMLWVGLRADEVRGLYITDIDPSLVFVDVTGKGRKTRRVYLSAPVREALGAWIAARGWLPEPRWAFYGLIHGSTSPVSVRWVERMVDRYLRASGLKAKGRSAHALRHTAAVLMVLGGAEREAVGDALGHVQLSTTDIYIRAAGRLQANPTDAAWKAAQENHG